jgi:hypothetical protein
VRNICFRSPRVQRSCAQGVARESRDGRRLGSFAGDVADRHTPVVPPGLKDIVEVTTDLVALTGCDIPGRETDSGDVRQ